MQHKRVTIGFTGDLAVIGPEIRIKCSIPVIADVHSRQLTLQENSMRSFAAILLAIVSTLATGCGSSTSVSTSSDSVALENDGADDQQVAGLDGLIKSLRNALESGDGDALYQLFYTENQPEDLAAMMKQQMTALVSNDSLELNEIRVFDFADHHPEPELPGELNGKKLKFLQPPSHWIIASMGGGDGEAHFSLDLTFPAREIDGAWKLLGSRYEEE